MFLRLFQLAEIVNYGFPCAVPSASEYCRKYGPERSAGRRPLAEIDLFVAPGFAFDDLAIDCDCHLASSTFVTAMATK